MTNRSHPPHTCTAQVTHGVTAADSRWGSPSPAAPLGLEAEVRAQRGCIRAATPQSQACNKGRSWQGPPDPHQRRAARAGPAPSPTPSAAGPVTWGRAPGPPRRAASGGLEGRWAHALASASAFSRRFSRFGEEACASQRVSVPGPPGAGLLTFPGAPSSVPLVARASLSRARAS